MATGRYNRAMLMVLVLGVWLVCAPLVRAADQPLTDQQLMQMIEKATTADDHAALAAYYKAQAAAMDAKASDHDAMAQTYSALQGKADWPTHCRAVASYYRKLAAEFREMATMHEGRATELRGK